MQILETARLRLRRLQPADLPALAALYADPEVRRYFPDGTRTLAQTREELDWFVDGDPHHPTLGLWATIDRRSGAFVGRCGLLPWQIDGRLEVELAFLIDRSRWREGLGSEAAAGIVEYAASVLGLTRLVCLITPGNVASEHVARKVGMRFERPHCDAFGPCLLYSRALTSAG